MARGKSKTASNQAATVPTAGGATPPAVAHAEGNKNGVLIAAIAALAGAAIGVVGSYIGADRGASASLEVAKISAQTALETQERQLAEERDREDRSKKAEVYTDFLDHADNFRSATLRLYESQQTAAKTGGAVSAAVTGAWMTARYDYQGSFNEVYAFGSEEAWVLAKDITNPASTSAVRSVPAIKRAAVDASNKEFGAGYEAFLKRLCLEVPAKPRTCTD